MNNTEVFSEIRSGYRLPRPTLCPPEVHYLCLQCWDAIAARRPTAHVVAETLAHAATTADDSLVVEPPTTLTGSEYFNGTDLGSSPHFAYDDNIVPRARAASVSSQASNYSTVAYATGNR